MAGDICSLEYPGFIENRYGGQFYCLVPGIFYIYGDRNIVQGFEAFIAHVRSDTGAQRLPFLVGQIAPRVYDPGTRTFFHAHRQVVQAAQREVVEKVPGTALVKTLDLPQSDNLHFDAGGLFELGLRSAEAYLSVIGR